MAGSPPTPRAQEATMGLTQQGWELEKMPWPPRDGPLGRVNERVAAQRARAPCPRMGWQAGVWWA